MSKVVEERPYQERIVNKVMDAITAGHKSILIEAPTGSGKTIMGLMIAKRLGEERGWRTGWTSMRKHLLKQASDENDATLKIPNADVQPDGQIRFFSTFDKNIAEDQIQYPIDLFIEDEGHHSASTTSTENYKVINPKVHIALTATPFRTDRMKLCFSKVIKDAGIRALIDQGYLSSYHQYIFHESWTPEIVARHFLNDPVRWGKSVIFFLTEDESQRCAEIIRAGGIKTEVVTGSSDQETQIESFNDGDTQVLINMVVLTEGFDSTILKTVWARPGSKGPTIQQVGRSLRKHYGTDPTTGELLKPFAQVVQNGASHWPFTRIASSEKKFVCHNGTNWEVRETNERVAQASRSAIKAIAKINVTIPPLLRKFQKRHFMTYGHVGGGD